MPSILLANARSLVNKLDELSVTLSLDNTDIAAVTETWFGTDLPAEATAIDGYNLLRKDCLNKRGGGVALYVKDCIKTKPVDTDVPDSIECLWAQLQPHWTPRDVSVLYLGLLYHPPWANEKNLQHETTQYLIRTLDELRKKHPHAGFILCGDFNNLPLQPLRTSHPELRQVVTKSTRADATLDLIITNVHSHYHVPDTTAPLGTSDHNCVIWKSKVADHPRCQSSKIKRRLVTQDKKDALGLCMGLTDWSEVYSAVTVEEKATTLYKR
ncbi:Hypp3446 [Branchiostoma lanceolatum]|uniref:Hypp3446 protein n=1 Tax=Branchiostoma lanceolatum TaxID=7740 RepID=A0A8K0EXA8_BRALA|nr:Hypp3446 [Branchiostoma lanceolatum]